MTMANDIQKLKVLIQNRDPELWPGGDSIMINDLSKQLNIIGVSASFDPSFSPSLDNFDIVMSWNMNFPWALFHLINAKLNHKAFVLFTMNFSIGDISDQQFLIKNADALVMFSQKEKKSIEKFIKLKIPDNKIYYLKQAVNPKFYTRLNTNKPSKRSGVICAGRIEPRKNQLTLIKACQKLRLPLTIIGNSGDKAYYQKCVKQAKKQNNTKFIDHVSQQKLKEFYSNSKVFALISTFEPWALSCLEAGLTGCNIVMTSNTYGDDTKTLPNCWQCKPNDLTEITNTLLLAHKTPLTPKLQKKILYHYSWADRAKKIKKIFYKVKYHPLKIKDCNNMSRILLSKISSNQSLIDDLHKKVSLLTSENVNYLEIKQENIKLNNRILEIKQENIKLNNRILEIKQENKDIIFQINQQLTNIKHLETTLNNIQKAKFFKLWQYIKHIIK